MNWTFDIKETSAGVYQCIGKRSTGNVVSLQCGEDEIYRVYQNAYEMEVNFGTLPSKALFIVFSGAKRQWNSEYHEKAFGSWVVSKNQGVEKAVYDGKDFYLMIYGAKEKPVWQGFFRESGDHEPAIFQWLL